MQQQQKIPTIFTPPKITKTTEICQKFLMNEEPMKIPE